MLDQDSKAELNRRLARGDITAEEYDRIIERVGAEPKPTAPSSLFRPPGDRLVQTGPEIDDRPRSYFARLWRGYISLPTTYWLWGSIGSWVMGFAAGALLLVSDTEVEAVAVVAALMAYLVFTIVSIWRSANRYKLKIPDRAYWGRLAQLACFLGVLGGGWRIVTLVPGLETDSTLDDMLSHQSANTPEMLNNNLRFDTVTRAGRVFTYHYTIIGPSHVPDAADQQSMRQGLVNGLCALRSGRHLLLSLDKATYTYANEQGAPLVSYDVARGDCP